MSATEKIPDRVRVRGVVREVRRYRGSRADLVVCTEDGRVLRGRLPAALRDVSVGLVGRRVAFDAFVDDQGRYFQPSRAELLTGFMRLSLTQVRAVRFAQHESGSVVVVDACTAEAGDAVLVMPVEVAPVLWAGLAEPAVLPAPNGHVR